MAKFNRKSARLAAIRYHQRKGHKLSKSSVRFIQEHELRVFKVSSVTPKPLGENELIKYMFMVDYTKGEHPVYFEAYVIKDEGFDFKERVSAFLNGIDDKLSGAFEGIGFKLGEVRVSRSRYRKGDTDVSMNDRLRKYGLKRAWDSSMIR